MMILETDLHLLVSKRGNLFDENCDGAQYFGNCCDKDDCVLSYKFLCDVLLRMHGRFADVVFH